MKITCNVRVARASYPQLEAAKDVSLRRVRGRLSGLPYGTVYVPADRLLSDQQGLDDHTLQLGPLVMGAQLGHLPTAGQAAVVAASPAYQQFAVAPLLAPLSGLLTPAGQRRWWSELEEVAARGAQPGLFLQTAAPGISTAAWLPAETRLVQSGREWFAVLAFELPTPHRQAGERPGAGIDLGLATLATAAVGGATATAPRIAAPDWAHFPAGRRSPVHRALYDALQYAAARASLERLGEQLVTEAGFVATEELDLKTFRSRFPELARRVAVIDWCWSTLPQMLHAQGIPLVRVDPWNSSRECHVCHSCQAGQRRRRRFACRRPGCGVTMDANLNAARVIQQRGAAALSRRGS